MTENKHLEGTGNYSFGQSGTSKETAVSREVGFNMNDLIHYMQQISKSLYDMDKQLRVMNDKK